MDKAFLEARPELRIVAGALKGYDNLDAVSCTQRAVSLANVPDLLAHQV